MWCRSRVWTNISRRKFDFVVFFDGLFSADTDVSIDLVEEKKSNVSFTAKNKNSFLVNLLRFKSNLFIILLDVMSWLRDVTNAATS